MMYKYIPRTILLIICLTALLASMLSCVNINMAQTPAENKTTQGDQAAPPAAAELPNIESFTASSASVLEGKSSTLSWSVKNATAIMITPGIGNVSATGSQVVTPASATTYTMVASNAAGMSSNSVVVNIMILRKLQPITKKPDLTIGGIKAVGQQGSPWYIYYTVVNSGTEYSTPCKVTLLQDGAIMETVLIDSIAPGDGIDHKCMNKLTPSIEPHAYEVRVDSDNSVVESDEQNNSRTVQLDFK